MMVDLKATIFILNVSKINNPIKIVRVDKRTRNMYVLSIRDEFFI